MADDPTQVAETLTAPDRPQAAPRARELRTVEPALYDLGAEIAHGGMGRIRAARDLRLDREVAIKELLAPDAEAALRFEREALVTARLQHPGIVAVYEAGRWPSGEPFYAMKRVHGRSLKKVIGEATGFDGRLALLPHVGAVADAMAYAHEQRIVHRDLKPANVLVGEFGETVVIDWGLAKDLDAAEEIAAAPSRSSDASLTRAGSIMGTPQYMPPEQARGEPIDERADVYAIGAMLYHLLAGEPPYAGETSQHVLSKVTAEPPVPLAQRVPGVAPDLLAIVERAMARDPSARYPTARELADDLRRFQTGQLVASHRYTTRELLRRFVRRHRVPLAIAGVAAIVVAIGAIVSVQRIRDERDQARIERKRADEQRAKVEQERALAVQRADQLTIMQARHQVDSDPLGALLALDRLAPGSSQLPIARVVAADAIAHHAPSAATLDIDDITDADVSADGKHVALASGDHSIYLVDLDAADAKPRAIRKHDDRGEHVAFSRDGRVVASSSLDGIVQVTELASGRVATFAVPGDIVSLALSSDGKLVAVATGEPQLHVYDVAAGRQVFEVKGARWLSVQRGDHTFAAWWKDGAHVLDLATLTDRAVATGQVTAMAFSRDGTLAAFARGDDSVGVVELATGRVRVLGRSPATSISALVLAPDGAIAYTIGASGELRAWPTAGGASRAIGMHGDPPGGPALAIEIAPDGKTLVTYGKTARLWDLDTDDSVVLRGPRDDVHRWIFMPDGALVLGVTGHELWFWPAHADEHALAHVAGPVHQVAYLPDGRSVVASDHAIAIAGGAPIALPAPLVGRIAFDASGKRGALLGGDGLVRVLDVDARSLRPLAGVLAVAKRIMPSDPAMTKITRNPDGTSSGRWVVRRLARAERDDNGWFDPVAISRDGATVAAAGTETGRVLVWTLATGASRDLVLGDTDVEALAFSPDGATLAVAGSDGKLRLYAVAGGEPRVLSGSVGPIEAIAFSPDGVTLASGGVDRTLRFWSVATGEMRVRKIYPDVITAIAYRPDGTWLAAGVQDKSVRLEDLSGGTDVAVPDHAGYPLAVVFDAHSHVVSCDSAGDIELTDIGGGRRTLRSHGASIGDVAISPDGTHFAAAGSDGIAREWIDTMPTDETALRARFHRPF